MLKDMTDFINEENGTNVKVTSVKGNEIIFKGSVSDTKKVEKWLAENDFLED